MTTCNPLPLLHHYGYPKIKSSRSDEAKKLALLLFYDLSPTVSCFSKDQAKEKRRHCYIQYSRLLRNLKQEQEQKQRLQQQEEQKNKTATCGCSNQFPMYKVARVNGNLETYTQLLSEPVKDPISKPTAMPVEISSLDDLEPFFTFLKEGEACKPTHNDAMGEYMSFRKGAFYTDGRIDLCKQVVGPTWIQHLMDSIVHNKHVRHFLLGNNIIGQAGGTSIARYLGDTTRDSRIETWYLAGNELDSASILPICEQLKIDSDCKSLWLKRNPLYPKGVQHLAKMLEHNTTIEVLDLVNVACFNEGVQVLFDSLALNHSLRYLYLDANGIDEQGAEAIAHYFRNRKTPGITNLTIGINRLGDKGAVAIASSLKDYLWIERLVLNANRIQRDGLVEILQQLQNHPSLILLDLGMYKSCPDMAELPNNFSGCGQILADFIRHNTRLKTLDVMSSHLTLDDLQQIIDALQDNHSLLYMIVHQYGLETSGEIQNKVNEICLRNAQEAGLCSKSNQEQALSDFKKLQRDFRYHKHMESVKLIDSIYRNNM